MMWKMLRELQERWRRQRVMHRIVQRREVETGDLHQVAHAQHGRDLGHVLVLVQAKLGGEHAAMQRLHALHDREAHDRGELAIAQLGLDHRHQVIFLVLVVLGVGVARDAEELAGLDDGAREQRVEVVRHDVVERREALRLADPQEARHAGADRHLDARQPGLLVVGLVQRDQKVERQARDEGEGMRGIDRQRRHQGKDVRQIALAQLRPLVVGKLVPADDRDAVRRQQVQQLQIRPAQFLGQILDEREAGRDLLLRRAAVDRQIMHAGADLLLQAADPLHEELVEIGVDDRQELDALEQPVARVLGLVQHPPIEGEPSQLAIEVERRAREVDRLIVGEARLLDACQGGRGGGRRAAFAITRTLVLA